MYTCRYCGASLTDADEPFKHRGEVFCNKQESILVDYAETFIRPPMPTAKGLKPMTQPFEEEL